MEGTNDTNYRLIGITVSSQGLLSAGVKRVEDRVSPQVMVCCKGVTPWVVGIGDTLGWAKSSRPTPGDTSRRGGRGGDSGDELLLNRWARQAFKGIGGGNEAVLILGRSPEAGLSTKVSIA